MNAVCAAHPGDATAVCSRCGTFLCIPCSGPKDWGTFCASCEPLVPAPKEGVRRIEALGVNLYALFTAKNRWESPAVIGLGVTALTLLIAVSVLVRALT